MTACTFDDFGEELLEPVRVLLALPGQERSQDALRPADEEQADPCPPDSPEGRLVAPPPAVAAL